jgi:hypothetical protein
MLAVCIIRVKVNGLDQVTGEQVFELTVPVSHETLRAGADLTPGNTFTNAVAWN